MSTEPTSLETITLSEIFSAEKQQQTEKIREAAHATHEAVKAELQEKEAAHAKYHANTEAVRLNNLSKIKGIQEAIEHRIRHGLDAAGDRALISETEEKMQLSLSELAVRIQNFGMEKNLLSQRLADSLAALKVATKNAADAQLAATMAAQACEAYRANPSHGIGPMRKVASWHSLLEEHLPIGFELSAGSRKVTAILSHLAKTQISLQEPLEFMPEDLAWLGILRDYSRIPCEAGRNRLLNDGLADANRFDRALGRTKPTHSYGTSPSRKEMDYFVVDTNTVVTTRNPKQICMPNRMEQTYRNTQLVDYSAFLSSLDEKIGSEIKALPPEISLDQGDAAQSALQQIIADRWVTARKDLDQTRTFTDGQERMSESEIYKLIGAYWSAFLASPWEKGIKGSYALLKHRCSDRWKPHFYSLPIRGHFGFRLRTPDHDWIIGEVYCPPEHLAPGTWPDANIVINHDLIDCWRIEVGPAKFMIQGTTSKT